MPEVELRCGLPFSDSMVLQAKRPVAVWGSAPAGCAVRVRFRTAEATATADEAGRWRVELPEQDYGVGEELRVEAAGATLVFRDVAVGEVWVAGGQSNMAWQLMAHRDGADFIAAAADANLRLLRVPDLDYGDYEPGAVKWARCGAASAGEFSAVAYFFGAELRRRLGCPVGIISDCRGATNNEYWTPRDLLAADPACRCLIEAYDASYRSFPDHEAYLAAHEAFRREFKAWEARGGWANGIWPWAPLGPLAFQRPGGLYETMIRPIQPYTIRGAIWYQGEGNSDRPEQYRAMFPLLVEGWRRDWGIGDFPFYYVQLPMYGKHEGGAYDWAVFREVQQGFEGTLANVGIASAAECGDELDIHPTWKRPIGLRLAALACNRTYGIPGVDAGPRPAGAARRGRSLIVPMRQAHGGLEFRGETAGAFELAGADGVWHPAEVSIDGTTLCCESASVATPTAARYAFANYAPEPLYNGAGFPALPFRIAIG